MEDKYIGKKYGRITITAFDCRKGYNKKYLGICKCGKEKSYYIGNLRMGYTTSCGCEHKRIMSDMRTTHGERHSRLYSIYTNMKTRCYNEKTPNYNRYGGRGIIICDEWLNDYMNFHNWAMKNGYKEDLSIDRIDNNGNYEPSNCRWATDKTQVNNRSYTWNIEIDGIVKTAKEWCLENGINYKTAHTRKVRGWSDIDCVTIKTKTEDSKE